MNLTCKICIDSAVTALLEAQTIRVPLREFNCDWKVWIPIQLRLVS